MNQTTAQLAAQALDLSRIAMQGQQTKVNPVNTQEWARFFEFQTFNDPQLEEMVNAAAQFILDIKAGNPPRWLSFVGTCGAGKTFLAKKIWKWFRNSEFFRVQSLYGGEYIIYPGQICHWPDLTEELRANQGYGRLDDLKREQLVILDDIGQEKDKSGHITEKLSILCSCRVGKWTVLTSNLSLETISTHLDTRIASRMIRDGSKVVDVDCPDFFARKERQSE